MPLVHLLKQNNPSGKVARWIAILSEFNKTNIRHLKGIYNTVPDILSRLSDQNIETEILEQLPFMCNNVVSSNPMQQQQAQQPHVIEWSAAGVKHEQHRYKPYKEIMDYLERKNAQFQKE